MAGFRTPGPLCGSRSEPIDSGTLCLWRTPPPGPVCRAAEPPAKQWHLQSRAGGFPALTLAFGTEGVALLKEIEELHLKPYDDQTGKTIAAWVAGATIGYGHLIAEADWASYKDGITATAADALFAVDMAPFEAVVAASVTTGLQQYEFDALVIFAFNIGERGFKGSSVVKMINDPKALTGYATLEAAWKSWNKSQGKVMKGLDNRRRCEWQIYTMARYERW